MLAQNNSKKIYSIYTSLSSSGLRDIEIINLLIKLLRSNDLPSDQRNHSSLTKLKLENHKLDYIAIVELIGLTHQKKKEKVEISNTDERKHHGIYYTDYSIAELITKAPATES